MPLKIVNPGLVAKQPKTLDASGGGPRGGGFGASAYCQGPQYRQRPRVSLHRDGICSRRRQSSPHLDSQRPARFGTARRTLVLEVVQAPGTAHAAGMVHRDVKPANVLLTQDGRAKLADFGLVVRVNDADPSGLVVAGTPTFMAPELFAGVPANPRTDFYALGIMYYYLLSGASRSRQAAWDV